MRTIIRAGAVVGGVWFVALFALQSTVALVVLAGVAVAGVCSGLAIAKWLERGWYGRQLQAGLRAGAIASGAAGLASLVALLVMGPHDVKSLAARSHALGLNLGGIAHTLGFMGSIGVDVVGVLLAVALGAGLSGVTAQIFAWSKSAKAVRIVAQARLAAQATRQDDDRAPYTTSGPAMRGQPVHAAVLLNQMATGAYGIAAPLSQSRAGAAAEPLFPAASSMPRLSADYAPPSTPAATPAPPSTPPARRTAAPAPTPTAASPTRTPVTPQVAATDETLADLFPGANDAPTPRKDSRARPASADLNDAMREALAAWADDNDDDPAERAAKKSAFLNTGTPAPKRGRRKNDTRDWLC